MAYYLDIFSPATYEAFSKSSKDVAGVREGQARYAEKLKQGDKLICYMTKLSRWMGILEVTSGVFRDETPRFHDMDDPYVIRVKVKPIAWLEKEYAIPIREDIVWDNLSLTKDFPKTGSHWTGPFRSSLNRLSIEDGRFLEELILSQVRERKIYPVDEEEYRKYLTQRVRGTGKDVDVSIPEDKSTGKETIVEDSSVRESIKIQALLARIGEQMGFKIWIATGDRSRVLKEWSPEDGVLLDRLPISFDEATLKTIERIDVLWIKRRAIVRAFEVEHKTSIYSGILRMADLVALQPRLDIRLHIVAPDDRRYEVFQEIQRPVFSLLEKGPLADYCTYISYDRLRELGYEKNLSFLSDKVIENYEEIDE
jgi:predicted RNA-binding protein